MNGAPRVRSLYGKSEQIPYRPYFILIVESEPPLLAVCRPRKLQKIPVNPEQIKQFTPPCGCYRGSIL
jgi:hypothetical protein